MENYVPFVRHAELASAAQLGLTTWADVTEAVKTAEIDLLYSTSRTRIC
jgi:hypothetical protein